MAFARTFLDTHRTFTAADVANGFKKATHGLASDNCLDTAQGAGTIFTAQRVAQLESLRRVARGQGAAIARDFAVKSSSLCP